MWLRGYGAILSFVVRILNRTHALEENEGGELTIESGRCVKETKYNKQQTTIIRRPNI